MRSKYYDFDPANASLTGFASNVTGATWTLTANDSGDSLAHRVSIDNDSATDHSVKTATLVGTDADGYAQTEVMSLPAATPNTTESTKYWLTLTSITPSATIGADTMDIGWVDEFASKTVVLDWYRESGPSVGINVTGTISLDVQLTTNNPLLRGDVRVPLANRVSDQDSMVWVDDGTLAAVTADTMGQISAWPVKAIRLIANSYTDTAEAQIDITSPV